MSSAKRHTTEVRKLAEAHDAEHQRVVQDQQARRNSR